MFNQQFDQYLEQSTNILIAGAGGGFDVFCGLPLFFHLKSQGKSVHLGNLSFTQLDYVSGEMITPTMMKVLPSSKSMPRMYFPEMHLSQWLEDNLDETIPVYAFGRTGVRPLLDNYRKLIADFAIDTIILVDGGTDSLMCGNEDGLGTPAEDLSSIAAASLVDVERKMLVCLGFGVDHYHGVSNDLSLSAIADLTRARAFWGSLSLVDQWPEVEMYRLATEYVFGKMPDNISIVSSSIISSLAGHYGNHHATPRTFGSKLWINPLMAMYWFFDLMAVAERNLFVDKLHETESFDQVMEIIIEQQQLTVSEMKVRSSLPD